MTHELCEDIGGAYALVDLATGETVRICWDYEDGVAAERALNGGEA